ncbi:MAG: hypothetical protein E6I99_15925 [Chloroflexi bacterium]|nr:MAG: hypothetical protein E6I99_15925 [Chloroflexota bacterium]
MDLNVHFSLPVTWFGTKMTYSSPKKQGANENALIPFEEVIEQRLGSLAVPGLQNIYAAMFEHTTRASMKLTFGPQFHIEDPEPERPNPATLPRRGWTLPKVPWAMGP